MALTITALGAVVAFAHWPREAAAERVAATTVVLEKSPPTPRPTPQPTPQPTPKPTPTPAPVRTPTPVPLAHVTLAPVQRAAPRKAHHAGGASRAPTPAPHAMHPRLPAVPRTAGATGVALAPGTGADNGSGSGTQTDAGSGAGNGSGGAGTGTVDADAPCGYVEFIPSEAPKIVGDVSYEKIRTTVHFPDGHAQSEDFPYPWVYADYMDTDPWSPINVRKTNLLVYAQLPPPGSDTHRYPEIVRYVLDHTNANGGTVLQPCPR